MKSSMGGYYNTFKALNLCMNATKYVLEGMMDYARLLDEVKQGWKSINKWRE